MRPFFQQQPSARATRVEDPQRRGEHMDWFQRLQRTYRYARGMANVARAVAAAACLAMGCGASTRYVPERPGQMALILKKCDLAFSMDRAFAPVREKAAIAFVSCSTEAKQFVLDAQS